MELKWKKYNAYVVWHWGCSRSLQVCALLIKKKKLTKPHALVCARNEISHLHRLALYCWNLPAPSIKSYATLILCPCHRKKNNNWFAMGLKLQFDPRPTGLNNGLSSQATLCLCWQGCKADYDANTVWPCFPSLAQSGFDTWQPSSPSFENKNERALQDMGQQINL